MEDLASSPRARSELGSTLPIVGALGAEERPGLEHRTALAAARPVIDLCHL